MRIVAVVALLLACRGGDSAKTSTSTSTSTSTTNAPVRAAALPIPDPPFEGPALADAVIDLSETADEICATRKSGHVDCWGGNGSQIERLDDIEDAIATRANQFERCVLRPSGVFCFDLKADPKPVRYIQLPSAPIAVYVGYPDCVVLADHRVACWKDTVRAKIDPHVRDVVALAGNGYATCAVHGDGTVSCRGEGRFRKTKLNHVKQLALGEGGADYLDVYSNGCAVLDDGKLRCFELHSHDHGTFAVGDWTDPNAPSAASLQAMTGATAIDMQADDLVALVGGKVISATGQAPKPLPKLADAAVIAHHCAVRAQGSVVCWGARNTGQPWRAHADKPVPVVGVADVVSVAAGPRSTWAVTRVGKVYHWGGDEVGWAVELGGAHDVASVTHGPSTIGKPCFVRRDGDVTCLSYRTGAPVDLHLQHVVDLDAGDDFLARRADGSMAYWMNISIGEPDFRITEIPAIDRAVTVRGNLAQLCALDADGYVRCGDPKCKWTAVGFWTCGRAELAAVRIARAKQIAAGAYSACAILETGEVSCWGKNSFGQLGLGSADGDDHAPAIVPGLHDAVAIRAGDISYCASSRDGSLTCWGTREFDKKPKQVLPPGSLDGEFSGGQDGCAIRRDGLVVCWGSNEQGRLGDGSIVELVSPAVVPGLH